MRGVGIGGASNCGEELVLIDSFDFRIAYEPYKVLEDVEIDLQNRIRTSNPNRSAYRRCFKAGESNEFEFDFCNHTLLRRNKITQRVQYLGYCREPVAYYHGWVYYANAYQDGRPAVFRIKDDGTALQSYDLINQDKMQVVVFDGHVMNTAVDTIEDFRVVNNILEILVRRRIDSTSFQPYTLFVTDEEIGLRVSKSNLGRVEKYPAFRE